MLEQNQGIHHDSSFFEKRGYNKDIMPKNT